MAGVVIGTFIRDPVKVMVLSFLLHYVMDFIPHRAQRPIQSVKDKGIKGLRGQSKRELAIKSLEPLLGNFVVWSYLAFADPTLRATIFLGGFFGWFPDLFVFLEWRWGFPRPWPFGILEKKFHKHRSDFWGIAPQIVVIIICAALMVMHLYK